MTDALRTLTDLLFLLWLPVGILVCGAGKALHDAWICDKLTQGKRYALCIAATAITGVAAIAILASNLSVHDVLTGLSLYRDANAFVGWFMTVTYALVLILPLLALITTFKVASNRQRPVSIPDRMTYYTFEPDGYDDPYTRLDRRGRLLGYAA